MCVAYYRMHNDVVLEFYRKCYKRLVICRNTRVYLMENIQTKGLINKLRSVDCLTGIQTRLVKSVKDKSRQLGGKNEDMLWKIQDIQLSFNVFVKANRPFAQELQPTEEVCNAPPV